MFLNDGHHVIAHGPAVNLSGIKHTTMEALFVLIGISLLVATAFLIGFMWAVRTRQYDDDFTPAIRMLFDSESDKKSKEDKSPK